MINNILIAIILLAVLYAICRYQLYISKKKQNQQIKMCKGPTCAIPKETEVPKLKQPAPIVQPSESPNKIDDVNLDGLSQITLGSYDVVNENIQEANAGDSVGSIGSLLEADAPNYL